MKTYKFYLALYLGLSAILLLLSCTNGDSSDTTQTVIQNNVQSGGWKITSFIDSGNDETQHFTGYTFTFSANGTLTASNGQQTHSGSWHISDSNSGDDSPDDLDFNILFNLTNNFEDLNEDWQFISQSASRIELIHISGGNGGTDYLTFEKV